MCALRVPLLVTVALALMACPAHQQRETSHEKDLESLYAQRFGYESDRFFKGYGADENAMPVALRHYREMLDRRIENLPLETIEESLGILEQMEPWQRYLAWKLLLVHYDYAGVPKIREAFSKTSDQYIRGVLVRCVAEISLSRHTYGKETLAMLAEAMSDHRCSWPLTTLGDEPSRVSELAYQVVTNIVLPEYGAVAPAHNYTSSIAIEQKQRSIESVGKWITENLPYLYIDEDTGKFNLDKDAAAQRQPTNRLQEWPPAKPLSKWKLPSRLKDVRVPYPGR